MKKMDMKYKHTSMILFLFILIGMQGISSVLSAEDIAYELKIEENDSVIAEIITVDWIEGENLGLNFSFVGVGFSSYLFKDEITNKGVKIATNMDEEGAKLKTVVDTINGSDYLVNISIGVGEYETFNSYKWSISVDKWDFIDPDYGFSVSPDSEENLFEMYKDPEAYTMEYGAWNGDTSIFENVTSIPSVVPIPVVDFLDAVTWKNDEPQAANVDFLNDNDQIIKSISVDENILTVVRLISTEIVSGNYTNHKEISWKYTYDEKCGLISELEITYGEEILLLIQMDGETNYVLIFGSIAGGVALISIIYIIKKKKGIKGTE